jgi:hypothetical protein
VKQNPAQLYKSLYEVIQQQHKLGNKLRKMKKRKFFNSPGNSPAPIVLTGSGNSKNMANSSEAMHSDSGSWDSNEDPDDVDETNADDDKDSAENSGFSVWDMLHEEKDDEPPGSNVSANSSRNISRQNSRALQKIDDEDEEVEQYLLEFLYTPDEELKQTNAESPKPKKKHTKSASTSPNSPIPSTTKMKSIFQRAKQGIKQIDQKRNFLSSSSKSKSSLALMQTSPTPSTPNKNATSAPVLSNVSYEKKPANAPTLTFHTNASMVSTSPVEIVNEDETTESSEEGPPRSPTTVNGSDPSVSSTEAKISGVSISGQSSGRPLPPVPKKFQPTKKLSQSQPAVPPNS